MFKLMDRVPDQEGVNTMLSDLEEHIYASGIADMVESADVITQVRKLLFFRFLVKNTFSIASLLLRSGLGKVRGKAANSLQTVLFDSSGRLQ